MSNVPKSATQVFLYDIIRPGRVSSHDRGIERSHSFASDILTNILTPMISEIIGPRLIHDRLGSYRLVSKLYTSHFSAYGA